LAVPFSSFVVPVAIAIVILRCPFPFAAFRLRASAQSDVPHSKLGGIWWPHDRLSNVDDIRADVQRVWWF
jgi:hypothetical protein